MTEFATRWVAVEQYQSIDDTIVQLLAFQTSGQISYAARFDRNAHDQEHKEMGTRKY